MDRGALHGAGRPVIPPVVRAALDCHPSYRMGRSPRAPQRCAGRDEAAIATWVKDPGHWRNTARDREARIRCADEASQRAQPHLPLARHSARQCVQRQLRSLGDPVTNRRGAPPDGAAGQWT